jgi:transcriptional regulator with PAS, ATPase and Fis domain
MRQGGFVPCDLACFNNAANADEVADALAGRSVVLLDPSGLPIDLALAVLRMCRIGVRDFRVLARETPSTICGVVKAAEGRAAYGGRPSIADPRAAQMIVDVERLSMRGRHAAVERTLRGAIAAFDRRNDAARAGAAGLRLGHLLLSRGRAADAKTVFTGAHDRFQRARAAEPALEATAYIGLAQTDLGQLEDAEKSCRSSYSAASALGAPELVLFPAIALARVLLWQKRYADARSILEAVEPSGDPERCARYWCLAARLQIAVGAIADAWRAVERARSGTPNPSPVIEAIVRECEAAVQGRLGDLEALRIHVTNGLSAARAAHLPLLAIKLRLIYVEGLSRAERFGQARTAARHLSGIRGGAIPPLLQSRIDAVLGGLNKPPSARESAASFHVPRADDVQDFDGLRDLLASSHRHEDESEALSRAATAIRRHTHAIGVGIFGSHGSAPRLFASSGASNLTMARRSIDVGQAICPERSSGGVEGAVPIQYLGRIIGAVALRWNVEGPESAERALAFGAAAAAVCAPLVYVLIEREGVSATPDAAFDLVGVSPAIEEVRKAVARAANAPFTVLLEGESGSGKELVARAVHRAGCRRERRFCALNCAAMPEDLVDAELFGHAKGAFTGAAGERLGLFEGADGGTVFLDEVGELSARAQAKVLRVLQEGEIRRIGENFTRPFDARLVAATNRSLRAEVDAGRFRQDLLYRLDVIRIHVPPLRERIEDIPLLAARFWRHSAERIGSKAVLGQSAVSALARYDWPGNVRELQNVLTALVVAVPPRGVVGASELPAAIARTVQVSSHESLESARLKFEERFVRAALARAAGHRGQTAAALGLSRQGLAKLMQRLHLDA